MGEKRGLRIYRVLEGKPERKIQLGRPRHRWKDNIKLYLLDIGWRGLGWIDLAKDKVRWRALVNKVMDYFVFWTVHFQ